MGRKLKVILQPVKFRKRSHVAVLSPNNPEVDDVVREFEEVEWSTGYRFWHLPLKPTTIKEISSALKGVASIDSSAFKNYVYEAEPEVKVRRKRIKTDKPTPEQQAKLEEFRIEFISKGYSDGTLKVYICMLNVFFGWHKGKSDTEITVEDVEKFLEDYIEGNNFTTNYKRLMTNSLRRYFNHIERYEFNNI